MFRPHSVIQGYNLRHRDPEGVDHVPERRNVMISSTARDLPDHRQGVLDACVRQGMFPMMMEHLPAIDADAIKASLDLVDKADIYLGILAYRYGYVPKGHDVSITEMEYNRAVERNIPRLIFLMHPDHRLKAADVETGEGATKVEALKKRVGTERVVNFFKSPEGLRADVINSLSHHRRPDLTALHYISAIPTPPQSYIAHPYTLLQSKGLVGRQAELNLLTDWVANESAEIYRAPILNVVAIGGMGKSALTWKWFNDIVPQQMKPLSGRMWWSFYESDATFENLVARALAYVTRRRLDEVQQLSAPEREEQLLAALNREPYLIVLDGLERILINYASMDAAHLVDDDLDKQTHDRHHRLRKIADPRAAYFLGRLSRIHNSRLLISTRLYPADLETITGDPMPGCYALFLRGLTDDDVLVLWRSFGLSGSSDELLRCFNTFEKHPLLIQALAREIANFRRAPRDFDRWRQANPSFDPFSLSLVQVRSQILQFAVGGLDEAARTVLWHIAAFRMPVTYDTLAALLVGRGTLSKDEDSLDSALRELEDRGLLGWDRLSNRYDLHPIVRGVVWNGIETSSRIELFSELESHFRGLESSGTPIRKFEDLTSRVELFNALIGLMRYDDAASFFFDRLEYETFYLLSANRQRVELLEMFFPNGISDQPCVTSPDRQAAVLGALAGSYHWSDRPGASIPLYRRANHIYEAQRRERELARYLGGLSSAARHSGALRAAEVAARRALLLALNGKDDHRRAISLGYLGLALAARGVTPGSAKALELALDLVTRLQLKRLQSAANTDLAQRALWSRDCATAAIYAERAWELATSREFERDLIRSARIQGAAALGLGDFDKARERLHHALNRSRRASFAEGELPALIGIAELGRMEGEIEAARESLSHVWELATRGPYPLHLADAYNVLSQIEGHLGNSEKAVEAANKAYRLAWCDGPPFAYHWGLKAAKEHLANLGMGEPGDLPAFDESEQEPMPEADI